MTERGAGSTGDGSDVGVTTDGGEKVQNRLATTTTENDNAAIAHVRGFNAGREEGGGSSRFGLV